MPDSRKGLAPLSDVLRRAIIESGVPYLTLEEATGVARASIMRFVRGEQSLRLDMADRLALYFGLSLQRSTEETIIMTPAVASFEAFWGSILADPAVEARFPTKRFPPDCPVPSGNWCRFPSGRAWACYGLNMRKANVIWTDVCINAPKDGSFDLLERDKEHIQKEFDRAILEEGTRFLPDGGLLENGRRLDRKELCWDRRDGYNESRIQVFRSGSIQDNSQMLAETRNWMITVLFSLESVFGPRLDDLTG